MLVKYLSRSTAATAWKSKIESWTGTESHLFAQKCWKSKETRDNENTKGKQQQNAPYADREKRTIFKLRAQKHYRWRRSVHVEAMTKKWNSLLSSKPFFFLFFFFFLPLRFFLKTDQRAVWKIVKGSRQSIPRIFSLFFFFFPKNRPVRTCIAKSINTARVLVTSFQQIRTHRETFSFPFRSRKFVFFFFFFFFFFFWKKE